VISSGDIAPRRDSKAELFVAVLSNPIHLSANTGRAIVCPFIPGEVSDDTMAMVVSIDRPPGTLLPELVQWLPISALDEPIGTISPHALRQATSFVTALIS
jgi:mRNA-degrading endonuclease toxin of MazEF toxin-antitoxin module